LLQKSKEVLTAVSPVAILVVILHFTLTPLPGAMLFRFLLGTAAIIIGLSVFLSGVDMGILPFGNQMGTSFQKSKTMWYVLIVGFILGFFINVAEPDLQILARQVASVSGGHLPMVLILVVVSIGTGVMLSMGIARIVRNISLVVLFAVIYGVICLLAIFSSADMMAIAFDASGATTGALTVPLVLALSLGVAAMKKGSASKDDSFGLVGMMSTGAILGILILNIFVKTDHISGVLEMHSMDTSSLFMPFVADLSKTAMESFVALLPMVLMLFVFQGAKFRLPAKQFLNILLGFLIAYLGLVLFLVGVHAGFMDVGNIIGHTLAEHDNKAVLVGVGFFLGMLVILTEPAVYVLTHQIENVTQGNIKRRTVLITLAIGVAFAVGLAMLRIVIPGIQLWHYLLPGYLIALALMRFVPRIFVGIAFDSGGVASGPMTATFILAFAQGASEAIEHASLMMDSFGVIAMVAMTPLIALQVLGVVNKLKAKKSAEPIPQNA